MVRTTGIPHSDSHAWFGMKKTDSVDTVCFKRFSEQPEHTFPQLLLTADR